MSVEVRPAAGGLAPSLSGALAEEPVGVGRRRALGRRRRSPRRTALHASAAPVATGQERPEAAHRRRRARDRAGRLRRDLERHAVVLAPRAVRPRPPPALRPVWHEAWERYCLFNEAFADTIAEEAATGATVVVNDYHLALVGRYLAKRRPDLATAFFTHTPFCPPEDLAMLPDGPRARADGVDGVLRRLRLPHGAVAGRVRALCVGGRRRRARDLRRPPRRRRRQARRGGREPRPAGRASRVSRTTSTAARSLLRSDRVELSKNLIRGFLAFDELLEASPRVARAARLPGPRLLLARVAAGVPRLPDRDRARRRAGERALGHRRATRPVVLDLEDDFAATVAALRRYDLLVVNPIRDGLNLVAKEGPAVNETRRRARPLAGGRRLRRAGGRGRRPQPLRRDRHGGRDGDRSCR